MKLGLAACAIAMFGCGEPGLGDPCHTAGSVDECGSELVCGLGARGAASCQATCSTTADCPTNTDCVAATGAEADVTPAGCRPR